MELTSILKSNICSSACFEMHSLLFLWAVVLSFNLFRIYVNICYYLEATCYVCSIMLFVLLCSLELEEYYFSLFFFFFVVHFFFFCFLREHVACHNFTSINQWIRAYGLTLVVWGIDFSYYLNMYDRGKWFKIYMPLIMSLVWTKRQQFANKKSSKKYATH